MIYKELCSLYHLFVQETICRVLSISGPARILSVCKVSMYVGACMHVCGGGCGWVCTTYLFLCVLLDIPVARQMLTMY